MSETKWVRGGRSHVLDTYIRLHERITVGEHWLWVALERIAAGEPETDVLADYGYMWARPVVPNVKVTCAPLHGAAPLDAVVGPRTGED
jgi:hypothetical protein